MTYHNATKYVLNAPTSPLHESYTDIEYLKKLWAILGDPQKKVKYLRLAGCSGKSICAQLLISVFKNTEYKLGCLTMPISSDIRKNIKIDAEPLSFSQICSYIEKIKKAVESINQELYNKQFQDESNEADNPIDDNSFNRLIKYIPTRQEIMLTVALLSFIDSSCSFCVIESENSPFDPSRQLPSPLAVAICGAIPTDNEAEIRIIRSYIRHGIQEIVSAPQDQTAYKLISETCAAINCRLTIPTRSELIMKKLSFSGSNFTYKKNDLHINLCSSFQITNATLVIEVLEMLSRMGIKVSKEAISQGIAHVNIPAEFEIISVLPTIIVDSAHSDSAINTVCASISDLDFITGKNISLCLPVKVDETIYINSLTKNNYNIKQIFSLSEDEYTRRPDETKTSFDKRLRFLSKEIFSSLSSDELLLISGDHEFALTLRSEILKIK